MQPEPCSLRFVADLIVYNALFSVQMYSLYFNMETIVCIMSVLTSLSLYVIIFKQNKSGLLKFYIWFRIPYSGMKQWKINYEDFTLVIQNYQTKVKNYHIFTHYSSIYGRFINPSLSNLCLSFYYAINMI